MAVVANQIRSDPDFSTNKTVTLDEVPAGKPNFARDLSRELGVDVIAPQNRPANETVRAPSGADGQVGQPPLQQHRPNGTVTELSPTDLETLRNGGNGLPSPTAPTGNDLAGRPHAAHRSGRPPAASTS